MLFTRIYDDDLAQASYFIGCQATGEAAVVDPRRDIQVYLEEAENNGIEHRGRDRDAHPRRLPFGLQRAGSKDRGVSLPLRRGPSRMEDTA